MWPSPGIGGGNLLYLMLAVAGSRDQGEYYLLETDIARQWLEWFPALRRLCIDRHAVKFTDRRLVPGPLQSYGVDFTASALSSFIDEHLMTPDSKFATLLDALQGRYDLTVNIRRGDYYTDPRWRGEYSFDVAEYVRHVIPRVDAHAAIASIHIVSDDVDWCRVKLGWLRAIAPLSYREPGATPLEQLAQLAASPRLILTNSTFSYWGGYLSEHIHPLHEFVRASIWAPRFHNRFFPDGGRATQLSPNWRVVETIPGGWDG